MLQPSGSVLKQQHVSHKLDVKELHRAGLTDGEAHKLWRSATFCRVTIKSTTYQTVLQENLRPSVKAITTEAE